MRSTLVTLAVCLLVIVAMPLYAASTGQAALHMPQGSVAGTPNGDYVSDSTALNTFYRYFIEVVPGTARLTVEIFDADVGRGANEDDAGRDRDRGGGWSTTATYTLLRPDGSTAATLGPCNSTTCTDNAWTVLLNSTTAQNTAVGHWELRVDTNGGNDINAIGIRAHDGTSGAGGTELNIYADSMISMGINPDPGSATRTYTLYPWITSGCQCSQNDFDRDTNNGNTGSVTYTSRTAAFTQTFASGVLSGDNAWTQNQLNRWGDDDESDDYGIWEWEPTISTYNNGATNGNYETAYVGSYLAPNASPTTNPILSGGVPATFRIYLPNDAGAAPVKPYLEQLLTQNRNFSGPNPTQVGQTTTFTVTIRVTNPTPFAILFNAANLVSTNIPGVRVLYGGNAAVSQGSIVTQPAVGGSGAFTWNPGSLASGGVALLSYDVRVTPTAAGQRNLVTPAPTTATSTRAQFIDETGNTTQARARYIMGGLCELAVTQGLVTEVMLSSFESDRGRVRWTTSSEAGTIGFNLYRKDGSRVNDSLIPAGRHNYEIDDRFGGSEYILEEVMASGRTKQMGPMVSHHRLGPDVAEPVAQPRQLFATAEARFETDANTKADAVMVGVRETGLVRVPFSELASRFGKAAPAIDSAARKGSLSVKNNGQPVAYTSTNDAIIFFGEKSDSIYSNERVYRIEETQGVRMASMAVPAASAAVSTFNTRADFETDALPATVLPLDPDGDYWFWDFVLSGDPDYGRKPFTLNVPAVSSTSGVQLEVRLQGALAGANHRARVSLNGVPVGDIQWKSIDAKTAYINIPSGVLRDGANDLIVEGTLESGAAFDVFYVDGFAVRYDRAARPVNGVLEASSKGSFVAGPFTAQPMTVDVTNRLRPSIVTGGSYNRGNVSMVLPAAVKTVFLAQQFVTPASYRSSYTTALRSQRADYVVIAPQSMRSGAEALASLRQREGLQTFVADLEQVYDEFSNGNVTPNAIRSFIGTATTKWSLKPRYVVLAGSGTLDYRGIIGAPGPVPPMMMQTQDGLFASDTRLADANGNGFPDAAIGRIPVANNTDLLAYVRKLRDHSGASDTQPMVFSADATDSFANFAADSALAALPLQSRPKVTVNVDELGAQGARNALLSNWQAGPGLVSWVGHGGFDQISSSGILTAGDVPSLQAQGRLPVMVAMTCTINRFEVPYSEPLGATLARDANGGALAVWSATGLSVHASAREMQQTFMRLAADKPQSRIGDLVMQTLALHPSDTAGIYLLLGDPAVALALPKEAVHGITPSAPGE